MKVSLSPNDIRTYDTCQKCRYVMQAKCLWPNAFNFIKDYKCPEKSVLFISTCAIALSNYCAWHQVKVTLSLILCPDFSKENE